MRTRAQRIQDRASFLTKPYEEPAVMLAHAISELCYSIDDVGERIVEAHNETRKAIDQLSAENFDRLGQLRVRPGARRLDLRFRQTDQRRPARRALMRQAFRRAFELFAVAGDIERALLGFHARAVTTDIEIDPKELEAASWFDRKFLLANLKGSRSKSVV